MRGAAHFLRETVGRVRYAGANGRLTLRADSGFYTHGVVSVCRKMDRSPSPSASTRAWAISSRRYQRMPGLPFPSMMWPRPPALRSRVEPDAAPVRLIVRRDEAHPGSQLALFASQLSRLRHRPGRCSNWRPSRRHAEIENAIRDLKHGVGLNHLPSGRFAANAAWLAVQVMAHNLARWTARRSGRAGRTTKTLRRRFFSLAGRITRWHAASHCICHSAAWEAQFDRALARLRALPSLPDGARPPLTRQPTQRPRKLAPAQSASASCRVLSRHLAPQPL